MTASLLNPLARTPDVFFGAAPRARAWTKPTAKGVYVGTLFDLYDGRWAVVRTGGGARELLAVYSSGRTPAVAERTFADRWAHWVASEGLELAESEDTSAVISSTDELWLSKQFFGSSYRPNERPTKELLLTASDELQRYQRALSAPGGKLAWRIRTLGEALHAGRQPRLSATPHPLSRADCDAVAVLLGLTETVFQDGFLEPLTLLASNAEPAAVLRHISSRHLQALQARLDGLFAHRRRSADEDVPAAVLACTTQRLTLADWVALEIVPHADALVSWVRHASFPDVLRDAEIPF